MSTAQQNHDRNQARFVISGVFLLGLAGMAFAAYFLQNIAGDHKMETSNEGEHATPSHSDDDHATPDSHATPGVSHTGIAANQFSIKAPTEPVPPGDVTVSGIGTPGSTVTVTAGDKEVKATVGPDGTWSAPFEFAPGEVTVTAADGKHPPFEAKYIVLAPDAGGPTLGFTNPSDHTRLASGPLTLTGTARPGELVRLFRDGTKIAEVKANDKGLWEFRIEDFTASNSEFKAVSLGDNSSVTVRVAR